MDNGVQHKDTPEQSEIINYPGSKLVVLAFAGTGKTTVLIKYALKNPTLRILYIAYNRAIADEAAGKFPKNVECKTSHQLAFASEGKKYAEAKKLSANLYLRHVLAAIESDDQDFGREVLSCLNSFICSGDRDICEAHAHGYGSKASLSPQWMSQTARTIHAVNLVWRRMIDLDDDFPMTHDGYLKLYQLGSPNLAIRYGAILLDEAQDSTPVVTQLVMAQPLATILVGDGHQQIYRFRGADNALNSPIMADADRMYLTNSFRFGKNVAMVANTILEYKGEAKKVVGCGGADEVIFSIPDDYDKPHAILSRTVMGVISSAIQATSSGKKVYWVGGIDAYQTKDLINLYYLRLGKLSEIKNKAFIDRYSSYAAYVNIAQETKDSEMRRAIRLLSEYKNIPERLEALHSCTVKDFSEANVTVCTAHRSKGLEFDNVALNDDFPDVFDPYYADRVELQNDELNLLYVAVTRAEKTLALNASVESVMRATLQRRRKA